MEEVILSFIQVSMYGKITDSMKDNGPEIKCQVKVFSNGQMEDITKDNFKMIRDMERVKCTIQMDQNILEVGITVNKMEWEIFFKVQN